MAAMLGWKKALFYMFAAAVWLLVLAAGAELLARWRYAQWEAMGEAYGTPRVRTAGEADEKMRIRVLEDKDAVVEPIWAVAHLFEGLGGEARQAFAEERGELVLLCDEAGVIEARYFPGQREELQPLAGLFPAGGRLFAPLPEAEAGDCRRAMQATMESADPHQRFYTVPLPDGGVFHAHFQFMPRKRDEHPVPGVGVFITRSIWEQPWFHYAPNVRRHRETSLETNSLGWRDDEVALPKPEGRVRVVCVGGSTTFEGPANALTYPQFVERRLQHKFGKDAVDVVNCGVETLDSAREATKADAYLQLEPDILVHYNFVNDLAILLPRWIEDAQDAPGSARLRGVKRLLRRSTLAYGYLNRWLLPGREEIERVIAEHTLSNMCDLFERARAEGGEIAVCSFAYPDAETLNRREQAYFDYRINNQGWGWTRLLDIATYGDIVSTYNRLVRTMCFERGYSYVPLAESMRGGVDTFTDICHMNVSGIQSKGEAIARALEPVVAARLAAAEAPEAPAQENREDGSS